MSLDPDCDCWTNDRGEWVLGSACARAELDTWRAAMDRFQSEYVLARVREPRATHYSFQYIDGKLTLVRT